MSEKVKRWWSEYVSEWRPLLGIEEGEGRFAVLFARDPIVHDHHSPGEGSSGGGNNRLYLTFIPRTRLYTNTASQTRTQTYIHAGTYVHAHTPPSVPALPAPKAHGIHALLVVCLGLIRGWLPEGVSG